MSELKAGLELDAAVDAQVFGESIIWKDGMPWRHSSAADPGKWLVPHYSTDISVAMQIVEKLRNSQRWCCIDIRSDYNYVWKVKLIRATTYDSHEVTAATTSESLPEAICLVVLKVVELGHKI